MFQRSDSPLIKHLYILNGGETARDWQRPPLIVMPGKDFVEYLMGEHREKELFEMMPKISHMPWDDFVFDFGPLRDVILSKFPGMEGNTLPKEHRGTKAMFSGMRERGNVWCRVRSFSKYVKNVGASSPWLVGPEDLLAPFRSDDPERSIAIELWEDNVFRPDSDERGFPKWPDVSIVDGGIPWNLELHAHLYPNPLCKGDRWLGGGFCNIAKCVHSEHMAGCMQSEILMATNVRMILYALVYLLQCNEYFVEVKGNISNNKTARSTKTEKLKPWLRENLPHVILLDPERIGEYGHPSGRDKKEGSHTSPRPHQRRGHWRRLRAERYKEKRDVFVKPAWVGATEWEWERSIYKVLAGRKNT